MNARLLPSLAVASLVLGRQPRRRPGSGRHRRARHAQRRRPRQRSRGRRAARPDVVRGHPPRARRDRGQAAPRCRRQRDRNAEGAYGDSWVYEATTDIFADRDADGYFRYLRVRFDVDSDLHLVVGLRRDLLERRRQLRGSTCTRRKDFEVFGSDPDDDYEVETELVSGYSTGLYDVLIELYDADTGELLDEYGPNESSEFSVLPLEDSGRDGVVVADSPDDDHDGGGGAISWLGLAGLLGALALRRRRRHGVARR